MLLGAVLSACLLGLPAIVPFSMWRHLIPHSLRYRIGSPDRSEKREYHFERRPMHRHICGLLFSCLIAVSSRAFEYDAEADIGLVPESVTAAVANRERLNDALNAQWRGGQFKFANGSIGPVLHPIRAAAKEFFFAGTIETPVRIGGALRGFGSRGYPIVSAHYNPPGGVQGGAVTRFTRIDGDNGGAIVRLRGAGFTLEGIEFRGRPYVKDDGSGMEPPTGTPTPVGIEVEGRIGLSTGKHIVRDCVISGCQAGICARAGYYRDGTFVPDENHADLGVVENVWFWACGSCFRSENQQAVPWNFRNIMVSGRDDTTVFDVVRGGNLVCDGLYVGHRKVTLFKVRDYSPNDNRLVCENIQWDHGSGKDTYFTLFQYDGQFSPPPKWLRWSVRVTGHFSNENATFDTSKLVVVPKQMPVDDLLFDIAFLPAGDFVRVGEGPWMRPKPR